MHLRNNLKMYIMAHTQKSFYNLKYFEDASPFILQRCISVTYQNILFMLCFVYVFSNEDLNHTRDMKKMAYISKDGPNMRYINKRLINVKIVNNNDKVAYCQNKIQSILLLLLLLYDNALLWCLTTLPLPPRPSTPHPPALSLLNQCPLCLCHDDI